jgi:hypothetical protein
MAKETRPSLNLVISTGAQRSGEICVVFSLESAHAIGALFPGDLLTRQFAQQGVPLEHEQNGDADRVQQRTQQGLTIFPDGKQTRHKRGCQCDQDERARTPIVGGRREG